MEAENKYCAFAVGFDDWKVDLVKPVALKALGASQLILKHNEEYNCVGWGIVGYNTEKELNDAIFTRKFTLKINNITLNILVKPYRAKQGKKVEDLQWHESEISQLNKPEEVGLSVDFLPTQDTKPIITPSQPQDTKPTTSQQTQEKSMPQASTSNLPTPLQPSSVPFPSQFMEGSMSNTFVAPLDCHPGLMFQRNYRYWLESQYVPQIVPNPNSMQSYSNELCSFGPVKLPYYQQPYYSPSWPLSF